MQAGRRRQPFHTGRMRGGCWRRRRDVLGLGPAQAAGRRTAWASPATTATSAISPPWSRRAVDDQGGVKLNKVWWVAGDVGRQVINPIEGREPGRRAACSTAFGPGPGQKITIEEGRVIETNFHEVHP